jgi:hypothetical protein
VLSDVWVVLETEFPPESDVEFCELVFPLDPLPSLESVVVLRVVLPSTGEVLFELGSEPELSVELDKVVWLLVWPLEVELEFPFPEPVEFEVAELDASDDELLSNVVLVDEV